jgi:hypothetical protein
MASEPEDLLERAAWYRERAEENRVVAEGAKLATVRYAYERMAETHEIRRPRGEASPAEKSSTVKLRHYPRMEPAPFCARSAPKRKERPPGRVKG